MSKRYSLFIGRWQPLHDGHKALIQTALDEGKHPLVAIRDTPVDDKNPYTVEERQQMIHDHFGSKVRTIVLPDIAEVCYGRDVGYDVRKIELSPELQQISGTKIRAEQGR